MGSDSSVDNMNIYVKKYYFMWFLYIFFLFSDFLIKYMQMYIYIDQERKLRSFVQRYSLNFLLRGIMYSTEYNVQRKRSTLIFTQKINSVFIYRLFHIYSVFMYRLLKIYSVFMYGLYNIFNVFVYRLLKI